MTSIARSINRNVLLRLFSVILLLNFLFLLFGIGIWIYTTENAKLEQAWQLALDRQFEWDSAAGDFFDKLETLTYRFGLPGERPFQVHVGLFLQIMFRALNVLLVIEFFVMISQYRKSRRKTEQMLRPLQMMAETADALSRGHFDVNKYHTLEHAIAAISPDAPEARIETGDKDLHGLETAINNLLARLHDSYRQQVRFVSDASHELRTPIAVIQGYADLLARWGSKDEKVMKESIEAIRDETAQMQKLVEQLLFLARGDAGRYEMTFETINLTLMMQEVYEEYVMIDKKHGWRFESTGTVSAVGDLNSLKQVARVLCDNAAKYSNAGEEILLRAFTNKKGIPCFSVQDAGVGIDPARARHSGGSGLGLSIAKWIIDQHRGYFTVLSREDIGTRIVVHLPVK